MSLLSVRNLTVRFAGFTAVDDVSFDVEDGETVALVGESGSGKSVTSLAVMGLVGLTSTGEVTSGEIELAGTADEPPVDLVRAPERVMRTIRGNRVAMIFQEPLSALNPLYTVGNQAAETLQVHHGHDRKTARRRVLELFDLVRIPDAARRYDQYPRELSGGMRQRAMIAMALACDPQLLIADEPTTALDVTVQAQVLALIQHIKELGTAVLFITHDMAVVAEIADRVIVMQNSRVVEQAEVSALFEDPRHPYTRSLLHAVPRLGAHRDVGSVPPTMVTPQ
ncbi:ABC transporter ATP-binding protein [Nocardia salmonicida]|uniref:ABC transporter ATP-binding protein n=1 Tax=Nocardia salmonicida TaxID=53431 RepID=A0ABZ1N3C6_9NOCA